MGYLHPCSEPFIQKQINFWEEKKLHRQLTQIHKEKRMFWISFNLFQHSDAILITTFHFK